MAKARSTPKKKPAAKAKAAAPSAKAKALHQRAINANWDDGIEELEEIVDDPACDLGTALAIYWLGVPTFDVQFVDASEVDGFRRETFTFLRNLEKRLLRRDFKTATILFNPRFDRTTVDHRGNDWTYDPHHHTQRRPIPEALKEPSCHDAKWEARGRKPLFEQS